jgi:hypothetical protein
MDVEGRSHEFFSDTCNICIQVLRKTTNIVYRWTTVYYSNSGLPECKGMLTTRLRYSVRTEWNAFQRTIYKLSLGSDGHQAESLQRVPGPMFDTDIFRTAKVSDELTCCFTNNSWNFWSSQQRVWRWLSSAMDDDPDDGGSKHLNLYQTTPANIPSESHLQHII